MPGPVKAKSYSGGSAAETARHFEADAAEAAKYGWLPASQVWEGVTLTVVYEQTSSPLTGSEVTSLDQAAEGHASRVPRQSSADSVTCEYPGCARSESLETCFADGHRMVCPAHRVLEQGSFVCATCREERLAAQAAHERRAYEAWYHSRHWVLAVAAVLTVLMGLAILYLTFVSGTIPCEGRNVSIEYAFTHPECRPFNADWISVHGPIEPETEYPVYGWLAASLLLVSPVVVMWRSGGFKRGVMDRRGTETSLYWLAVSPALIAGFVLFIALAAAGAWGSREAYINRNAEAVRRGIDNSRLG